MRLLDAAQTVFLEKGFVAASVEDIAKSAGYTRGAFYSNFPSKMSLFLELLRRDHESILAGLHRSFEEGATWEETEKCVLRYVRRQRCDDKCFLLWIEAKLLAVRDLRFRASFEIFSHERLGRLSEYITDYSIRTGTPLPMSVDTVALGLVVLWDGLQLQSMGDPHNMPDGCAEQLLDRVIGRTTDIDHTALDERDATRALSPSTATRDRLR